MSTLGLSMMVITWVVVIAITARFFLKVLKKPQEKNGDE